MPTAEKLHPTQSQLQAFAQGRMSADDLAAIEIHIRDCDVCCRNLSNVTTDDPLARLAREVHARSSGTGAPALPDTRLMNCDDSDSVAVEGKIGHPDSTNSESEPEQVPPELRDHPRYRIVKILGKGGMGVVWLAEHQMMQRMVALKVISSRFTSGRESVERFRQEVRAAARLTHPNIVTAFDAEQAGDLHFLVTEYVEGRSLEQWVQQNGVLTVAQACSAIRQVCSGLQHAHSHGMIHRDIKPQNLMQAKNGKIKILDFGLARLEQHAEKVSQTAKTELSLTVVGMVLGTPDFMAPEQAADSSSADARSDIYSLGCTLFFLLAGRAPFEAGSFMEMISSGTQRPMTVLSSLRSDLPPELNRVIEKMTAPRPENRFRSAAEVADALAPFCQPVQGTTNPVPAKPPTDKPAKTEVQASPAKRDPNSGRPSEPAGRPRSSGLPPARRNSRPRRSGTTKLASVQSYLLRSRWKLLVGTAGLMLAALLFVVFLSDGPIEPVADTVSDSAGDELPSPETVAPSIDSNATVASGTPPRILYLVPATDLWWPDVAPFSQLHNSRTIALTLTSWRNSAVSIHADGEPVPIPLLLSNARAVDYDALIVGGGRGLWELTKDCEESRDAERLIREMLDDGKIVAGFSAGPGVLAKMGLLNGVTATGHKLIHEDVRSRFRVTLTDADVVRSGQIITGRDVDTLPQFTAELLRAVQESR
ncbi:MAG: protein kinase [Fuerstia sp.]|nr:protein kinase [Fuerstiella sp.]